LRRPRRGGQSLAVPRAFRDRDARAGAKFRGRRSLTSVTASGYRDQARGLNRETLAVLTWLIVASRPPLGSSWPPRRALTEFRGQVDFECFIDRGRGTDRPVLNRHLHAFRRLAGLVGLVDYIVKPHRFL